jgi:hypothetical protein
MGDGGNEATVRPAMREHIDVPRDSSSSTLPK